MHPSNEPGEVISVPGASWLRRSATKPSHADLKRRRRAAAARSRASRRINRSKG